MKSLLALGIALAVAAPAAGQDAQNRSGQPAAGAPSGAQLDQQIAGCLLLGNQAEVALAEFAKDKCQNDQCKQFADMMIEQHREAISKIEQAAPQIASLNLVLRNAKSGDRQGQDQNEQNSQDNQNAQNANAAGGINPSLMLARQIKEECLAITTKALEEKQGDKFDQCYITQQVIAHMGMLAELKGAEPFASAQLKPVIKECMQVTQKHLDKAKELMKQIEEKASQDTRQAKAGN